MHLPEDQRQAEIRRMVKEIEAAACAENQAKGRQPLGVAAILAQDPHSRPASTDRSPAPFVHASDEQTELDFRAKYRDFVNAFRTGAIHIREPGQKLVAELFPASAFPPALACNTVSAT